MRPTWIVLLGAVALGACRPAATPQHAPVPVTAPAAEREHERGAPLAVQAGAQGASGASAERTAGPSVAEPAALWDIEVTPYESHERVEHYVRRFTGPVRGWTADRLARGTRYEAMIREKLRAGGVPEDLYYLAFVESGFDATATSRASAVGLWQFMPATAKGMGLRVDWWVDERRDPIRATDAAVRFLGYLHGQFGSLYLAAAAYNGGPGRVSRGLTQFAAELETAQGEDRFFALSAQEFLPRETRDYVPQIIAAALVGKLPERYGLEIEARDPFAYDSVQVPALTSLPAIAAAAGTTMSTMRDLNPHFIRAITPPGRASTVRIPEGSRDRFERAFATMPPEKRAGARSVRVAEVASLANLASRNGTTAGALRTFNPAMKRTPKGNVAAGQTLLVPTADVAGAALSIPDPSLGVKTTSYHVVKQGETLSHIAQLHGTTVASLIQLNHLKKATIFPGQELVVAGTATPKPAAATNKASANAPAKAAARKSTAKKPAAKKPAAKKPGAKAAAPRKPAAASGR